MAASVRRRFGQAARRRMPGADRDLERTQRHRANQVGVGDDAAGARRHGEAGEETRCDGRAPGRHAASCHEQDRADRPAHCRQERDIDRREEQAAVEITGHQAERDRDRSGPASDREVGDRDERRQTGDPRQESHGVAHRDRVCQIEGLSERREDLVPGPVVPEKLFHGREMRAVGTAAQVPGERLRAVVVGVELVDGKAQSAAVARPMTSAMARSAIPATTSAPTARLSARVVTWGRA